MRIAFAVHRYRARRRVRHPRTPTRDLARFDVRIDPLLVLERGK
jgi:hypothetical protein